MIHTEWFTIWGGQKKCEMFSETNIDDIASWLSYGGFKATPEEEETLLTLGIAQVSGQFISFSKDLKIPDKVYLRETSFAGRSQAIERSAVGEEVFFVHAKDPYDALRLEVINKLGSLGYLPSEVSDEIAPLLLCGRLAYTAKISELTPVSKRNKHAKSSIVGINIETACSSKPVEIKTAVPDTDHQS
ncbi:MAG: hypothetical protein IKG32_04780 [Clostridia bacterium]|nr:hypothetical protein [Clostridia bacterium]